MTIGEIVNAFGTLILAALAIWGDRIRSLWAAPKLTLVLENSRGSLLCPTKICYQLKVLNRREWATATSCRVQLRSLWRRNPNGEFVEVRLPYPLVMSWPPSEWTPWTITVVREEPIDFGVLQKGEFFWPAARVFPNIMRDQLQLSAGQTMRYGLEVVSDQFASPKLQVFEVSWNGQWSENVGEMPQNLQIREVRD